MPPGGEGVWGDQALGPRGGSERRSPSLGEEGINWALRIHSQMPPLFPTYGCVRSKPRSFKANVSMATPARPTLSSGWLGKLLSHLYSVGEWQRSGPWHAVYLKGSVPPLPLCEDIPFLT